MADRKNFPLSWRQKFPYIMAGWLIRIILSLIFRTCRITVVGQDIERNYLRENPGKGLLYASWHQGICFFVYFYRFLDFVVMASSSRDGEIAAQATHRFGWINVRGSSTRGGPGALHQMVPFFMRGHRGGLVVDAPLGPRYVSKAGIISLAKKTGLPIIPVIWSTDRCWRLRSWDKSIIPKPFSRIVFLYHDRFLYVPPEATGEQFENCRRELDLTLNRLMYQTDRFFSIPGLADPREIPVPDPVPLPD